MDDPVERAVRTALPGRTIDAVEDQTTRPGNETAGVTFADADPVYVKTATDTAVRLTREVAALCYAGAHCPMRVPAVVAADPAADPPYLVTDPLPGTPMNDGWTGDGDRERLLRETGRAIAGVHEPSFDRPGVIEGGDADGLELTGEDWTETLCATVEWRAGDWFPDRFADLPPRLVETIRAVDPEMAGSPTLIHCDCSRINVHLDPGGLLDWERALVGDPAFDLVDATFHHLGQPDVDDDERPALEAALYDGYRERAGRLPPGIDELRPLYRAIAHLLVPQAFEDWAPRVEDRTMDVLAADVREEFDSRLERARETLA